MPTDDRNNLESDNNNPVILPLSWMVMDDGAKKVYAQAVDIRLALEQLENCRVLR